MGQACSSQRLRRAHHWSRLKIRQSSSSKAAADGEVVLREKKGESI